MAFWSAATGCSLAPAPGNDGVVTLRPAEGDPWVELRAVDEAPLVHLELGSADPAAAAAEGAAALGAVPAGGDDEAQHSPGGLLLRHTAARGGRLARPAHAVLDQVCIDVPGDRWETELEFWRRLTGRVLEAGLRAEFAFLGDPDPQGPARILMQRLDRDGGEVRAHPDFAVADRPAQAARHVALGAEAGPSFDDWTVLTAPDGIVYCLTDRDPVSGWVERGR